MPSRIAYGSDCQMTCRGSNLDSNLNSAAAVPPDHLVVKILSAPIPQINLCGVWILFRSVENAEIEDSSELISTLILLPVKPCRCRTVWHAGQSVALLQKALKKRDPSFLAKNSQICLNLFPNALRTYFFLNKSLRRGFILNTVIVTAFLPQKGSFLRQKGSWFSKTLALNSIDWLLGLVTFLA